METVLLMAVFVAANIVCFVIGASVGQKAHKGDEIKLPKPDPLQSYREHQAEKEAQRAQSQRDIILQNIENYNGSSQGQREVPGR